MKALSTFEKCKAIRRSLLIRAGEALSYSCWSDSFKLDNLKNIFESLGQWEKEYGSFKINPNDLTAKQMNELGFGRWTKEDPMRLIPIWLFPFLCEKFECQCIDGSKHTNLSELDNDHRMGCIAYGVIPKK